MNKKLKTTELNRLSAEKYKAAEKADVILLLDNIRSMHNIGSIFRTADAFLVKEMVLCGITACPPHREIQKTALGATESVPWRYEEDAVTAAQKLVADGYTLISVEQTSKSLDLQQIMLSEYKKPVLVFGNEVEGVQQAIIDLSAYCVEIPQFGSKHSFNVSVCAGIVLWEIYKSRNE